jgi:hypothetical protein
MSVEARQKIGGRLGNTGRTGGKIIKWKSVVKMHNECRFSERKGYGVGVEVTCCR